jgi:hypothetical protein
MKTENLIRCTVNAGIRHTFLRAEIIRKWLDGEISDSFIEREVRHVLN